MGNRWESEIGVLGGYSTPNQAVRLDLKAVYVAIPKNGTTGIRQQFASPGPYLVDCNHLTVRAIGQVWDTWFLANSLNRNRVFPTDPELVRSDREAIQESKIAFKQVVKFATIRNPFSRALSLYHRREAIQIGNRGAMSFDEFCEKLQFASDTCFLPSRNRFQIDWLTGWDEETLEVENLLRLENLDAEFASLGKRHPELKFLKTRNRRVVQELPGTSYREKYSLSSRRAIEATFAKDFEAFSYDW